MLASHRSTRSALHLFSLLVLGLLACEREPVAVTQASSPGAASVDDGHHSHFRYGTMSWAPTGNRGEVRFRLRAAFRRSAYSPSPVTGDVIQEAEGATALNFGDGSVDGVTPVLLFKVTAHSIAEDWIVGEAIDPTFVIGPLHTYGTGVTFTAFLAGPGGQACCRLTVEDLANRSFLPYPLFTTVQPQSGNSSPVSAIAPIVVLPPSTAATFLVPAVDPDGDRIRWRLSDDFEAGGGQHPPGLSIDGVTGQVTWDNSNLDRTRFWTTTIMVEDLDVAGNVKSTIPVDFFLRIRPEVGTAIGTAPTCAVSPVGPLSVAVGEPLSFTVTATDPDAGASVTLNSAGMPSAPEASTILPVTGASPLSAVVTWIPVDAVVGSHVALFTATDDNGLQGLCSVTIAVRGGSTATEVAIDIKPGAADNLINLRGKAKIPVAVLTTADFNAASLDPRAVTLGNDDGDDTPVTARKNGTPITSLEDLDQDGDLDLVLQFDTQALVARGDLAAGTTELILNGVTTAGGAVRGSDGVRIGLGR